MASRSISSRLSSPIYFVELANLHFVSSRERRFREIADQPGNIPLCESLNTTNNPSKIGYRLTTAPPANHTREPDRHPVQPNPTPPQNIKQVDNNSLNGEHPAARTLWTPDGRFPNHHYRLESRLISRKASFRVDHQSCRNSRLSRWTSLVNAVALFSLFHWHNVLVSETFTILC